MLKKFVNIFGGDPNKKVIEKLSTQVEAVNAFETSFEAISDEALRAKTDEFRSRLAAGETLDALLPEAFAVVREASKRTIGLRHYDVQIIGGIVLHRGEIAEMRTGEGKTLVATLPVYLNALTGRGVHLITVNDYLARRDARWMAPIYAMLGLTVGVLQMAARTENGKKAFLVDLERTSPHEDQDQLRMVDRRLAYEADITYGTNSEFGFDYLRDNMAMRLEDRVQRGHHYAIIDEVDNVLIDEARTPLIISGPAEGDIEWYGKMAVVVRQLKLEDYEINEKDRTISLTEIGLAHVEQLLGQPLSDPDRPEDVTPEQARLLGYLEQALRAHYLFKRNKDYLVQAGKVVIVDEYTGRLMPGRRWSDGLHQAVEAKEGVRVEPENITYATITLQNYFRMYEKLAGMTGTALTEAEEFDKIYSLEVLPIPTNLEYQASLPSSPLVSLDAKDEDGYRYTYYSLENDPQKKPVFWKRKDYPDVIFRTQEAKLRAIVFEIIHYHVRGRPQLVGTTSVESSDTLSNRLRSDPVRRLLQVHLIRHAWMEQNNREEDGRLIPELQPLNTPIDNLDVGLLRQFTRSLGISLNPEDPENLVRLREILILSEGDEPRLKDVLKGGVPHEVLNARKHTEESQIIAGAGAFGAVTIATNMAGRGVDIKLGGEMAEEVIANVNRVLRRGGIEDPYDTSLQDRRKALLEMDRSVYSIYESEVDYFLQYFDDMERVRELGGLHVIGSERHDARRIDNQLRGRSARQGDPGSSRFYLSLEDDLMRLFGGGQVGGLMERLQVDESVPLENRLVGNIIEQSQHRVEGANFDVRKHLLEYDDVLNAQRMRIYSQRDRIFTKEDLTEDVGEMLAAEVQARVPLSFSDREEGPWRLLAWMESIQPPFTFDEDQLFPSFTYRLLLDELDENDTGPREGLLDIVTRAVQLENGHILRSIGTVIDRTGESLNLQLEERFDALDTFLEGRSDLDEAELPRPQESLEELNNLVRIPLKLSSEQLRQLNDDPLELEDALKDQVETFLVDLTLSRLVATIEHRLGESLELNPSKLKEMDWDETARTLYQSASQVLERREERLVGENGQVTRDLDATLDRKDLDKMDEQEQMRLLISLSQSTRTSFDSKSHRQVRQVIVRLQYFFLAAQLFAEIDPDEAVGEVLDHLEEAQATLVHSWGANEWNRLSSTITRAGELGPAAQAVIAEERLEVPPAALTDEERQAVIDQLGLRQMNEIYRAVLLDAITRLWVDYLTRVEALRVSIGLEAYAQRDPLVQYKSRASEMFQNLLVEIRSAVVGRMFLYLPRQYSAVQLEAAQEAPAIVAQAQPAQAVQEAKPAKKKKRRRRH